MSDLQPKKPKPKPPKQKQKQKPQIPKFHQIRKQLFLTDTQTSDYTKSSTEMQIYKIQQLELTVRGLEKENEGLKQVIVNMRANQCFQVKEEKVRELVRENQRLRAEVLEVRGEVEELRIQGDFLRRFNKNLKNQCELLTKKLLSFRNSQPTLYETITSNPKKPSLLNSSSQDLKKAPKRSISSQPLLARRKHYQKQKQSYHITLQPNLNPTLNLNNPTITTNSNPSNNSNNNNTEYLLNFDYFHGSFNQKKNRYNY